MKHWDLEDLNSFMSKIRGEEVIKLGDSAIDPIDEEMQKDENLKKELGRQQEGAAPKKKKK